MTRRSSTFRTRFRRFIRRPRTWRIAGLVVLIAAGALGAGLVAYAERKLSALVLGGLGESFSTEIYSAPFFVGSEVHGGFGPLLTRLDKLDYVRDDSRLLEPGEYGMADEAITLHSRGFRTPMHSEPPSLVRIEAGRDGRWRLFDESDRPISGFSLEPTLVAELSGRKKVRREPASWSEFSPDLVHAVAAAEDHKFFQHWGVRPLSILRAFMHNVTSEGALHGGSTITQQLVKNLFLTPERTLRRKALEAFLAIYLEIRFTKEKILTLYLNHIYLGQDGYMSVAGMKAAAEYYFGKSLERLSLSENALLAGLIRSPYLYNPYTHPKRARTRRDHILKRMLQEKWIRPDDYFLALNAPVPDGTPFSQTREDLSAAYFVSEIVRRLRPLYGEDTLHRYGLKIYTTMDPLLQDYAHQAIQETRHQAALVALEPRTGAVLALVGGTDFSVSQFNRATQARRQPGSAFKPFVYGAALESGIRPTDFLDDEKRTFVGSDGKPWTPRNFDDVYRGSVTVRTALARSVNAATLDLIERVEPRRVIDFARRAGIESPLEPSLALALGVYETSLLELTAAYAPFANGGFRVRPVFVTSLVDADGNVIQIDTVDRKSVFDPALSYLITSMLEGVVKNGTASNLLAFGWERPTAGKTGTTNGGRDAWFIGYTPRLLAGVWVGEDEAKAVRASGSRHALPLWYRFANSALANAPRERFESPEGLIRVAIDPATGQLARSGCPQRVEELLLPGTEPKEKCALHRGGVRGWFDRIFNGKDD